MELEEKGKKKIYDLNYILIDSIIDTTELCQQKTLIIKLNIITTHSNAPTN